MPNIILLVLYRSICLLYITILIYYIYILFNPCFVDQGLHIFSKIILKVDLYCFLMCKLLKFLRLNKDL